MKEDIKCYPSFGDRFQKSMASANGPKRDQLRVLATAVWFEEVRRISGGSTYYEIERFLEPEAFRTGKKGTQYHTNKWSKYAVGLHQPTKRLADEVDKKIPGTSRLLRHPLWDILRDVEDACSNKEKLYRRLSIETQAIIAKGPASGKEKGALQGNLRQHLIYLERRADIDVLAYLSILAIETFNGGHKNDALKIVSSLYRVYIILCANSALGKFKDEIYPRMRDSFFDVINDGKFRLGMEHVDITECASNLCFLSSMLKNTFKTKYKTEEKAYVDLLAGKAGKDIRSALNPPLVLLFWNDGVETIDKITSSLNVKKHECGLLLITDGKKKKTSPIKLFRLMGYEQK